MVVLYRITVPFSIGQLATQPGIRFAIGVAISLVDLRNFWYKSRAEYIKNASLLLSDDIRNRSKMRTTFRLRAKGRIGIGEIVDRYVKHILKLAGYSYQIT
jgi:hypothetical protein